jgi:hypothetical protein
VLQLRLPSTACVCERTSGLAATTSGISSRIACASSTVSVFALPPPMLTPPSERAPGKTSTTF